MTRRLQQAVICATIAVICVPLGLATAQERAAGRQGISSERDRNVDNYFRGRLVRTQLVPPTGEETIDTIDASGSGPNLDSTIDVGLPASPSQPGGSGETGGETVEPGPGDVGGTTGGGTGAQTGAETGAGTDTGADTSGESGGETGSDTGGGSGDVGGDTGGETGDVGGEVGGEDGGQTGDVGGDTNECNPEPPPPCPDPCGDDGGRHGHHSD